MTFLQIKNNAETTIDGDINDTVTEITVTDVSVFPSEFPYLLTIWNDVTYPDPSDDSEMELVLVTGAVGNVLTVQRGYADTDASSHYNGNRIALLINAEYFTDATYGIEVAIEGKVDEADARLHSHDNKSVLDLISSAGSGDIITDVERTKLGGIQEGATDDLTDVEIVALINQSAEIIDDDNIASTIARDVEVSAAIESHRLDVDAHHTNANDPTVDQKAAMNNASSPSGANPFATQSDLSDVGSGDMLKSEYDTDNDGIVDKAELLDDGGTGKSYADISSEIDGDVSTHASDATAHHSNVNDPTSDQKSALDGANSPSGSNVFVTVNDLSDLGGGDMMKATYDTDGDGKVNSAEVADSAPWSGITGKPSTYPPETHTHTESEISDLGSYIPTSEKGAASGVATLDINSKVPTSQLPDSVTGALEYQGLWDASTNTPTLDPLTPSEKGHYYKVSVAGTFDSKNFAVGDWLISNGTEWDKLDGSEAVSSVDGKVGAVDLSGDYAAIDHNHDGDYSDINHDHAGVYEPIFAKGTAFNKDFGTEADTVCVGNDSRLSDARTPLAHNHTESEISDLGDYLLKSGGVMSGNIDMNGNSIVGGGTLYINPGWKLLFQIGGENKFEIMSGGIESLVPMQMNANKITNLGNPSSDQDAATKSYVDGKSYTAADISDFDTEVSNNTDVAANTSHRGSTSNPHGVTASDVGALPLTGGNLSGILTFNAEYDNGTSGAIDWNNGQKQKVTLASDLAITFTDFTVGIGNITLKVVQDATGGWTPTWPGSVTWLDGDPVIDTAANAVTIVTFYFDGTTYWGAGPTSNITTGTGTITTNTLYTTSNGLGKNIKVGDDGWIGDVNVANFIGVRGVSDETAGGFLLGSAKDTNLYRGGANILKTDDLFQCVGLDVGSQKITNVAEPTSAQDAATKAYVDADILAHKNDADAHHSNANDPTPDEKAAMTNANAPSSSNPFATMDDVGGSSTPDVIGIKWDRNSSNPSLKHIDIDGNEFTTVSTIFFNDHPVWGNMWRCLVDPATGEVTYGTNARGDGLDLTGASGEVMVSIPKFYVKYYSDSQYIWIWISSTAQTGFEEFPSHVQRGGVSKDRIFVSAYEASGILDSTFKLRSATGKRPVTGRSSYPNLPNSGRFTIDDAETYANNIGSGFGCMNIWTMSAIRLLFYVEMGSLDSQTALGRGIVDRDYGTGFAGLNTGADSADANIGTNGTGTGTGSNGYTPIVYRGLENLWGNVWQFCIGYNAVDAEYRITKRDGTGVLAGDLAAGEYEASTVAPITTDGYQSDVETENLLQYLLIGSETAGSSSTYLCDYFYVHDAGETNILLFGGYWAHGSRVGVGYLRSYYESSISFRSVGARFEFIPQ